MYRIRFLLPLLPLLAACATRHAAPSLATTPIPALSYAAVLDGGTVTPIESPVIVKYAPYPTASFERLGRGTGTGAGETVSFSERTTGTTFADTEATGDLVSVTFAIQNVTATGNMPDLQQESLSIKGAKVILLISEPFGPIKNITVSMPPAVVESGKPRLMAQQFARAFIAEGLPKTGIPQAGSIPYHDSHPATDSESGSSFEGKAVVLGKGFYRGRPVIVFDLAGVLRINDQPLGFHSYMFRDAATGIWCHREGVAQGSMSYDGKAGLLSLHIIDDVRF